MKTWMLFIIVFCVKINSAIGCGYYPVGESVRFSFVNPYHFNYPTYASFNYNANEFGFNVPSNSLIDENVTSWYNYFQQRVDAVYIQSFLYRYSYTDTQDTNNVWLKFLHENNRQDVLKYLLYAKKCEDLNGTDVDYDPWERGTRERILQRSTMIKELEVACKSEPNQYLQRRYAFLIVRLAHYSGDEAIVKYYFKTYFTEKDFLYYWALFFYCFTNEASELDYANVLIHSPDKRSAIFYYFRKKFNLNKALSQAQSNEEKANAYAFASIQKLDKALPNLKAIYNYKPDTEILSFLLLREVNKLEDWIYTPYYRNFNPSNEYFDEETNTQVLRKRSERERLYAKEVLAFVQSVDLKKIKDPILFQTLSIHLQFMTRDFDAAIKAIDKLKLSQADKSNQLLLDQIKGLCLVSLHRDKSIFEDENIRSVIEKNINNNNFLFALGRELEYMGNVTEGIALLSFSNRPTHKNERFSYDNLWRGNRNLKSGNLRFFYNYFDYVDFVYTADNLKKITDKLQQPFSNDLEKFIYNQMLTDKNYLLDLLGMKYIREQQLVTALNVYKSMDVIYWQNNYNAWERDIYDNGYYAFDHNPFYDYKFTPSNIRHKDPFVVTKISLLEKLIEYQSYALDTQHPDRAYYAFLTANCYYNMSAFGNSWMMRRFSSSIGYYGSGESYVDEKEYINNHLAQQFYELGYKVAATPKMKALCLRMKLYVKDGWPSEFEELYQRYPEYYLELSSCSDWNQFIGK